MCSEQDTAHLKRFQMGIFDFSLRLELRGLPRQQHSRCHTVSFVMCNSGEKFEEPCSDISGDILDSVELFMMSSLSIFA